MDKSELKMIKMQEKHSENLSERNELISKIYECIDKINLELGFFALEATPIRYIENPVEKCVYELYLEDDRFVVYISKNGKLLVSYNKEYVKLFSDNGLKEIYKILNDFIVGFENGTSELRYCVC